MFGPFAELYLSIVFGKENRNAEQEQANFQKTIRNWTIVNEHLKENAFMAGDKFSIADVFVFLLVWKWKIVPEVEKPNLAALVEYFERSKQVPHAAMFMTIP